MYCASLFVFLLVFAPLFISRIVFPFSACCTWASPKYYAFNAKHYPLSRSAVPVFLLFTVFVPRFLLLVPLWSCLFIFSLLHISVSFFYVFLHLLIYETCFCVSLSSSAHFRRRITVHAFAFLSVFSRDSTSQYLPERLIPQITRRVADANYTYGVTVP